MDNLTTGQVAELLLGIARSQLAIADAIESSKAGFKSTHLRSSIETAARIKMNRPETLADFPARLLLQMLGRSAPTLDAVTRDFQALLGESTPVANDGGSDGGSLDMR
jgi:hypothetical protein